MADKIRVLVVGVGNMGRLARHGLPQAAGLRDLRPDEPHASTARTRPAGRARRLSALPGLRRGAAPRPGPTRSRSTPGPTPMPTTRSARWTPAATCSWRSRSRPTYEDAEKVVAKAHGKNRKLVLGYILRHHPSWAKFVEVGRTLGKPLVMRMNLNQQSLGPGLELAQEPDGVADADRRLRRALCRHHVPDDPGEAGARARHRRAALATRRRSQNYGHLHVVFDDGSVGWYEAGWGPMMSEVAYFVKDVVGPKGCVSIVVPQEGQSEAKADAHLELGRHRPAHQDQRAQGPLRRHRRAQQLHAARTSGSTWPTSPTTRSCATASRPSS